MDGIGDSPLKEEIAELKYLVIDNDINRLKAYKILRLTYLVGEGVGDCGGNKWIMLLEAFAIAGFIASFGYEDWGSCGLTDPVKR